MCEFTKEANSHKKKDQLVVASEGNADVPKFSRIIQEGYLDILGKILDSLCTWVLKSLEIAKFKGIYIYTS